MTPPQPGFELAKAHRWFAVECNNVAWDLLEKPNFTPDDRERMLHAAHAACFHWAHAGNEVNRQRALCLLAEVHAELGHAPLALQHARLAHELSGRLTDQLTDFDRTFVEICLARALAANGHADEARRAKQTARDLAAALTDADDRRVCEETLRARSWHGVE